MTLKQLRREYRYAYEEDLLGHIDNLRKWFWSKKEVMEMYRKYLKKYFGGILPTITQQEHDEEIWELRRKFFHCTLMDDWMSPVPAPTKFIDPFGV